MSYHTSFTGKFTLNTSPTMGQAAQFKAFTKQRQTINNVGGNWCLWALSDDGMSLHADNDGETFHGYEDWLAYVIAHFIKPWGLVLNGEVSWEGEEGGDLGKLVVVDNVVTVFVAEVHYVQRAKQPKQ